MTITEMLGQSGILTILGMTVVFVFLWIMIICVNMVGRVIRRLGLDKDVQKPPVYSPAAQAGTPPQITAAISAAVNEYRKNEKPR
jgi:oxaloacetate decarboxylase gamma subunit